jgi:hypothetical protein
MNAKLVKVTVDVLKQTLITLEKVHLNWPDLYHDAVGSCIVCKDMKRIRKLLNQIDVDTKP